MAVFATESIGCESSHFAFAADYRAISICIGSNRVRDISLFPDRVFLFCPCSEPKIGLCLDLRNVAGPAVLTGLGYHADPNRVELDTAIAGQKIGFSLNEAGIVAALLQVASAPAEAI